MRVRSRTTCIKCDACVLDIRRHYRSINPYSEVQLCTTRRGIRFTLPPDMYCRHGYIIKVYPVRGCGKTATRMNLHLRRAHGLGTNALARRQDPPRMSPCRGGGPGGTSRQPSTTGPLRPIDPPTRTSPKHQFTSDRGHLPTHSARGHFRPILDAYVEERDVAPPEYESEYSEDEDQYGSTASNSSSMVAPSPEPPMLTPRGRRFPPARTPAKAAAGGPPSDLTPHLATTTTTTMTTQSDGTDPPAANRPPSAEGNKYHLYHYSKICSFLRSR